MKKYIQFITEDLGTDENLWRQAFAVQDMETMKNLLDINPNYINDIAIDLATQSPTLVEACRKFPDSMIEFLIENGADVNKCTSKNISPIFCAARKKNVKIVKLLLSKGANPNVITIGGSSPLIGVAEMSWDDMHSSTFQSTIDDCMEIIRLLLKAGADPYYNDPNPNSSRPDGDGDFWSASSHFLKQKITEEYPEILKQLIVNKKAKRFDL